MPAIGRVGGKPAGREKWRSGTRSPKRPGTPPTDRCSAAISSPSRCRAMPASRDQRWSCRPITSPTCRLSSCFRSPPRSWACPWCGSRSSRPRPTGLRELSQVMISGPQFLAARQGRAGDRSPQRHQPSRSNAPAGRPPGHWMTRIVTHDLPLPLKNSSAVTIAGLSNDLDPAYVVVTAQVSCCGRSYRSRLSTSQRVDGTGRRHSLSRRRHSPGRRRGGYRGIAGRGTGCFVLRSWR